MQDTFSKRIANLGAFMLNTKVMTFFVGKTPAVIKCWVIGKLVTAISLVFVTCSAFSQSADYPLNTPNYAFLDRYVVKQSKQFFTTVKPYSRKSGASLLGGLEEPSTSGPLAFNRSYLLYESREFLQDTTIARARKPLWKRFYKFEPDLVSVRNEGLDLHVNPVGEVALGNDNALSSPLFVNTRGIDIRGTIDNKIAFATFIHENQLRLPGYIQQVQDTVGVIPREGFWKEFGDDAYDFLRAQGYVDFGITKHFSAQFGFGRHFVGNGKRSMILSDFANSYPYLRLTTEVWKIKYTNIFAELVADVFFFDGGTLGSRSYPNKFFAFHHLDIAITEDFHLGLFESVLHGRPDSLGGTDLKFEYLNPIIFYGAIEQQDGSADNAIVGLDFRWDLLKRMQLYGQFILDELIIDELLSNSGWWGNKYGFQLGLKHFDFLVPTWNWQLEYNQARPFTYSHDGDFTAYTHYRQPLAHPLGANFRELIFITSYQPLPRITLDATLLYADYGSGPVNGFSIGRDPNINSNNRGLGAENDFGNRQGQGIASEVGLVQLVGSYQWKHNLFFDLQFIHRQEDREDRSNASSNIFVAGIRWNIARRTYLF